MTPLHLLPSQVDLLNEKHGYFKYGDAQGAVSRAFAHDAVSAYKRMCDAAPDLLEALCVFVSKYQTAPDGELGIGLVNGDFSRAREAIAKAIGIQP